MSDNEEMSMEEILASIRRYVSDETPETNQSGMEYTSGYTADVIRLTDAVDQGKAGPKADFIPYTKVNDQDLHHDQSSRSSDVRSPKEPQHYPFTPPSSIPSIPQAQGYQKATTTPMAGIYRDAKIDAPIPTPPPIQEPPSIISQEAMQATSSAFSKLSDVMQTVKAEKEQQAASQKGIGASAIETFVMEMARPMIRQWIDQHLPGLVDKLVTQEIEKLMDDLRKKML